METKVCLQCNLPKPITNFAKSSGGLRRMARCRKCRSLNNPEKTKRIRDKHDKKRVKSGAKQRSINKLRVARKIECFNAYSNNDPRCSCPNCPEHFTPHIEFLQLDHINNDGAAHRRDLNKSDRRSGQRVYADLRKKGYPPGYQLLCANCNWFKRESKTCPHLSTGVIRKLHQLSDMVEGDFPALLQPLAG